MWYNWWQTQDCSVSTACWSNAFSLMKEVSCEDLFKSSSRNMKVVGRPESQLFLLNRDTFQNNFKVHGLANILLTPNCIQISITFLRNWTNNFNRQPVLFSITFKQPARWTAGFLSDRHYEVQHMNREVAPGKCCSKVTALYLHQLPGWREKKLENLQPVLPL